MLPATTDNQKVRFHTLNAKTGNRVLSQYVDAISGDVVRQEDEVKGYPRGADDFVQLEQNELDEIALESTRTIDIDMFVPADSVESIWYDRPHYLVPNDPVGEEAFSVIRDAMKASGKVGISRLVMYRRERAVLLEPREMGVVLWTLRYGDEVRDSREYFSQFEGETPDSALMELVAKLIENRTIPWSPDMTSDPVQLKLLEIIAAKKNGSMRPAKTSQTAQVQQSNVVNIMNALKKSIAADKKANS